MRITAKLVCPLLVALLAACGDDGPTDIADPCTDDTGTVSVTVTQGANGPVFAWSPDCAVAFVLVEAGGGDTWFIGTDDSTWDDPAAANLIAPPVTYGVAPQGVMDEYGPDPLTSGITHDFILYRVPPGSTADCLAVAFGACMLANHQFVP